MAPWARVGIAAAFVAGVNAYCSTEVVPLHDLRGHISLTEEDVDGPFPVPCAWHIQPLVESLSGISFNTTLATLGPDVRLSFYSSIRMNKVIGRFDRGHPVPRLMVLTGSIQAVVVLHTGAGEGRRAVHGSALNLRYECEDSSMLSPYSLRISPL